MFRNAVGAGRDASCSRPSTWFGASWRSPRAGIGPGGERRKLTEHASVAGSAFMRLESPAWPKVLTWARSSAAATADEARSVCWRASSAPACARRSPRCSTPTPSSSAPAASWPSEPLTIESRPIMNVVHDAMLVERAAERDQRARVLGHVRVFGIVDDGNLGWRPSSTPDLEEVPRTPRQAAARRRPPSEQRALGGRESRPPRWFTTLDTNSLHVRTTRRTPPRATGDRTDEEAPA